MPEADEPMQRKRKLRGRLYGADAKVRGSHAAFHLIEQPIEAN